MPETYVFAVVLKVLAQKMGDIFCLKNAYWQRSSEIYIYLGKDEQGKHRNYRPIWWHFKDFIFCYYPWIHAHIFMYTRIHKPMCKIKLHFLHISSSSLLSLLVTLHICKTLGSFLSDRWWAPLFDKEESEVLVLLLVLCRDIIWNTDYDMDTSHTAINKAKKRVRCVTNWM